MERDGFDISSDREPVPADYLADFDEADELTEAQKLELLGVLFEIMKSFALMGYGMEPVSKLLESFEKCATDTPDLVEFEDGKSEDEDA